MAGDLFHDKIDIWTNFEREHNARTQHTHTHRYVHTYILSLTHTSTRACTHTHMHTHFSPFSVIGCPVLTLWNDVMDIGLRAGVWNTQVYGGSRQSDRVGNVLQHQQLLCHAKQIAYTFTRMRLPSLSLHTHVHTNTHSNTHTDTFTLATLIVLMYFYFSCEGWRQMAKLLSCHQVLECWKSKNNFMIKHFWIEQTTVCLCVCVCELVKSNFFVLETLPRSSQNPSSSPGCWSRQNRTVPRGNEPPGWVPDCGTAAGWDTRRSCPVVSGRPSAARSSLCPLHRTLNQKTFTSATSGHKDHTSSWLLVMPDWMCKLSSGCTYRCLHLLNIPLLLPSVAYSSVLTHSYNHIEVRWVLFFFVKAGLRSVINLKLNSYL